MLASPILPTSRIVETGLFQSGWVFFHITVLFLANSLFALAASVGVMYLLQERQIKEKKRSFLFSRLPNLGVLDKISHNCLLVGFPLMTAGLVAGFAYASLVWHTFWRWDPKEILSLITWLIYAFLIHERLAVGLRGRRAAWLAILGFSAVLVTFLGVNLILKGHHTAFAR
jgi:cytochrome c-type biogenesis protein CcsB